MNTEALTKMKARNDKDSLGLEEPSSYKHQRNSMKPQKPVCDDQNSNQLKMLFNPNNPTKPIYVQDSNSAKQVSRREMFEPK